MVLHAAAGLQLPGVLDELFAYDGPLGADWSEAGVSIRVWAPTAQSVELLLFEGPRTPAADCVAMSEDAGMWSYEVVQMRGP